MKETEKGQGSVPAFAFSERLQGERKGFLLLQFSIILESRDTTNLITTVPFLH